MKRPVRTAKFNGRKYHIEFTGKLDGWCDQYERKGRYIIIQAPPNTRTELETILHEGIHAGKWDASEENVTQMAEDLARLCWRLGYRKK